MSARRKKRHSRRMGRYDPRPRIRRRKSVPPQLRAWVFRRRRGRTHDPGYMSSMRRGPRGGTYFAGPKKRRYDPAPRRFRRARAYLARHPRYGRVASKLEAGFNRFAMPIGLGIGALVGVFTGYDEYKSFGPYQAENYLHTIIGGDIKNAAGTVVEKRGPEIAHLWSLDASKDSMYLPNYLKYKFLGLNAENKYVGSAWLIPFWFGIGSWIFSKLPLGSKLHRIQSPLGKIGTGMAAISAVGALALPGSPNGDTSYSNIPSAGRGLNEPGTRSLPAPEDGRYHNI